MKLTGCTALVVGADNIVGSAVVQGLMDRGADKIYTVSADLGRGRPQPGRSPLTLDPTRLGSGEVSREPADVNLLVNCLVSVRHRDASLTGVALSPLSLQSAAVRHALKLIEAFVPVLAANGGGAVANILASLSTEQPLARPPQNGRRRAVEWTPTDGLRERLAAQKTQLLHLSAQLAIGGDQELDQQCVLAGYVAMRMLDRIQACRLPSENHGPRQSGPSMTVPEVTRRLTSEQCE